jgi:hypothetical protein
VAFAAVFGMVLITPTVSHTTRITGAQSDADRNRHGVGVTATAQSMTVPPVAASAWASMSTPRASMKMNGLVGTPLMCTS